MSSTRQRNTGREEIGPGKAARPDLSKIVLFRDGLAYEDMSLICLQPFISPMYFMESNKDLTWMSFDNNVRFARISLRYSTCIHQQRFNCTPPRQSLRINATVSMQLRAFKHHYLTRITGIFSCPGKNQDFNLCCRSYYWSPCFLHPRGLTLNLDVQIYKVYSRFVRK